MTAKGLNLSCSTSLGMVPPVARQHYGVINDKLKKASEAERQLSMSLAAHDLRKNARPDEIIDVNHECLAIIK